MGLWNKIVGELVDIIEWTQPAQSEILAYRFPRYNNEIKYGAKLTVREGQAAVFVNEGQIADVYQPGMYTLQTENMPILSISAEGTYHRVFDVCIPKWLNQAGAKDDFVRLEDVGIHGNMHEMFLDRNSQDVIKFTDGWLNKNVK